MKFGDALSFVLLIDKVRDKKGESLLRFLPGDYLERIRLQIPENMGMLLRRVVRVLLDKSGHGPLEANEIAALLENVENKEHGEMFEAVIDYLRESREEARTEGLQEGIETTARNALAEGLPLNTVQKITGLDIETLKNIQAR